MSAVIERVDSLEQTVQEFVHSVGIEFKRLYRSQQQTQEELRAFKDEMRVFKDEMRVFKDEMSDFKDEMRVFKDEMHVFKDEMSDFKDEMRVFKDEMSGFKDEMGDFKDEVRRDRRETNKQWGELSNRLGTMVEDLVAPSLPRIVDERFKEEVYSFSVRFKRRLPDGSMKEFDAFAVTPDHVFLNSTKSTLRIRDVKSFIAEIDLFRTAFPEYASLPLIGVLASLAVDESLLIYAERRGFLILAVGDELMEVKNRPGFEPKPW